MKARHVEILIQGLPQEGQVAHVTPTSPLVLWEGQWLLLPFLGWRSWNHTGMELPVPRAGQSISSP